MKSIETPSKRPPSKFIPVLDTRNRRVPGLYQRNGRFYAQLWVRREDGQKTARKFPLLTPAGAAVANLNQAKESADVLRNARREDKLPTSGHKPRFADYMESYFAKPGTAAKKKGTLGGERGALNRWKAHLRELRIDRITTADFASFRDKRLLAGIAPGTVNLDIIALRNVLNAAIEDGHLRAIPNFKTIKVPPAPKRPLLAPAQFDALLAAVPLACKQNPVQFADYLRFLAFTGAREQEALKVRWDDVSFKDRKVLIGFGGVSKNRDVRVVDFNPKLAALLEEMHSRRAPDCTWLFPSPRRGPRDAHAKSFRESLKLTRKAAGLEWMAFHDLRHRFASFAVMAGLDYMTIADWLGHKDGGMLVARIYGHLTDTHKAKAARKLKL